ncbi:MAG: hypothetical protein GXO25_00015 [Euryarchaeota archaeon]|nr:hypothetical protein [Euryarchaeota archaeon]
MMRAAIIMIIVAAVMIAPAQSILVINAHGFSSASTPGDRDGDGVNDSYELNTTYIDSWGELHYKLDPCLYDSWYDGLSDGEKVSLGLVDRVDAEKSEWWESMAGDVDGDGLRDDLEIALGLDPLKDDTDGDGIPDSVEILYFHTDPLNNDTDGDGLLDGYEVSHKLVELEHEGIYLAGMYVYDCGYLPEDTDPLNPDTDGDGLSDGEEFKLGFKGIACGDNDTYILLWDGPIPTMADTDGDGLNDYQELQKIKEDDPTDWVYYYRDALKTNDLDGDGLTDYMEWLLGTNITLCDTDGDSLDDGYEVNIGTDPLNPDTDGDGLSDYDEVKTCGTDPTKPDSDGDGLNDSEELSIYPEPNATNPDTDGDGLSDYDEVKIYGTDPTKMDSDGDGLNDSQEIKYGTNPKNSDTDGDGLDDLMEIEIGTNPALNDTDGDGLSDYDEWYYGTNPNSKDTDNDNLTDGEEYNKRTDPTNPDTDGDGIPDGSDSDPGTSSYWDNSHYLPSIYIFPPPIQNYKPGKYVHFEITLHGNLGTVNVSVKGPGKLNVTSFSHTSDGWTDEHINLTFLHFDGNHSVVEVEFVPENGAPTSVTVNVINPRSALNVSRAYLPLNFPTDIYFNFTGKVKYFSLAMPSNSGTYTIESISNNSVKVKFKMNEGGKIKLKINADIYNSSHYCGEYTLVVGNDEFSEYESRLNRLIEKVNNYINVSVNTDSLKQRYYNGDERALEELKSIIRVEALTLTAAVMISNLVDELANTAVDVISFKTLLDILLDKLKESETYQELVEYITEKINALANKIMRGLNVDESLVDNMVDAITEKAGESLDSTLQEYRERLKTKFVEWMYTPLKNAHDSIVYTYLSENESKERRLKIYDYAEEGVGMMNLLSTVSEVSESIEETSSLIGEFSTGMPPYKTAMEIIEKVAAILSKSASALEKFEAARTITNIIDAYKGDFGAMCTVGMENESYVVVYSASDDGDVLAKIRNIVMENYSEPTVTLEQIKMLTYSLEFLHGNGTLAMLNSTADRFMMDAKTYIPAQDNNENVKYIYVDAPDTVMANKEFNISIRMSFNSTVVLGNMSKYGDYLNFSLNLSEGSYRIPLKVDDVERNITITAINISEFEWNITGSVIYAHDGTGLIAINTKIYNETPEEFLGTNETGGSNSGNGGSENNNNNNGNNNGGEKENNGKMDISLLIYAGIGVAIFVAIATVILPRGRKKKESGVKKKK